LASNSLLEAAVYGESAGRLAAGVAQTMADDYQVDSIENKPLPLRNETRLSFDLADVRNALKSLLWRTAGVVRSETGLSDALMDIEGWSRYVLTRQFDSADGWELQNMLTVAQLLLEGAAKRRETRGAHNRSDFTETLPLAEHSLNR